MDSRQIFNNLLCLESSQTFKYRINPLAFRNNEFTTSNCDLFKCKDSAKEQLGLMMENRLRDLKEISSSALSIDCDNQDSISNVNLIRKLILNCAPLFYATQHLLHSYCSSWNNEVPSALLLLKSHAIDFGHGTPEASRIDRYCELAKSYQIDDIKTEILSPTRKSWVEDFAYDLPSKLLLISCYPETFASQIIGINLFLRNCGYLPPFQMLRTKASNATDFLDLAQKESFLKEKEQLSNLAIEATLKYFGESNYSPQAVGDVLGGFEWLIENIRIFSNDFYDSLSANKPSHAAMLGLIEKKRPEAAQYHRSITFQDDNASLLFKRASGHEVLRSLASSRFVRPGEPEKSALIKMSRSPKSKMFRIFSKTEIDIIWQWISELPAESNLCDSPKTSGESWSRQYLSSVKDVASEKHISPRNMYSKLLRAELSKSDLDYTCKFAEEWLEQTNKSPLMKNDLLPREWSMGALTDWMRVQHTKSMECDIRAGFTPSNRDTVINDIRSLAPLTMIDGAWLTGFSHPDLISKKSTYLLFETYFDELGNGVPELNHPKIYRHLFQKACGPSANLDLKDFSRSSLFEDSDFLLPVYWLSISKHPLRFLPEILGLNLAMEMSGVGGGYTKVALNLKHYGMPTHFADLHNSIDNISTGHAAWATNAIDRYMCDISIKDRKAIWNRIEAGYASLRFRPNQSIAVKTITFIKKLL